MNLLKIRRQSIRNIAACAGQYLNRPDLAVIGGYHGGNLGDMALGGVVATAARKLNRRPGLQMIYNLQKWPAIHPAIVGGGAVTFPDLLERLKSRYRTRPESLAILGVDIEDFEVIARLAPFLKSIAYFSTRSKRQADQANEILGENVVRHHPDIVFSMKPDDLPRRETSSGFAINVSPRFHTANPDALAKDKPLPSPVKFSILAKAYEKFCRQACEVALDCGQTVDHIAFTPTDEIIARKILSGLPVNHISYSPSPHGVLTTMAGYSFIVPCRYHSTIYSLIQGRPCLPFAYTDKCVRLFEELDFPDDRYVSVADLLDEKMTSRKVESVMGQYIFDSPLLNRFKSSAAAQVTAAIKAVCP